MQINDGKFPTQNLNQKSKPSVDNKEEIKTAF